MKKNRVFYQEVILDSMERIPFIKRFWSDAILDEDGDPGWFDSEKINAYMGYKWTKDRLVTSDSINEILEEAERRGDL